MGRGRYGGTGRAVPREVKAEIGKRLRRGEKWREVAAAVGVSEKSISRIVNEAGGMSPRWKDRNPRQLSLAEREEISRGLERHESFRVIGAALGRQPSTGAVVGSQQGVGPTRAIGRHEHDRGDRP